MQKLNSVILLSFIFANFLFTYPAHTLMSTASFGHSHSTCWHFKQIFPSLNRTNFDAFDHLFREIEEEETAQMKLNVPSPEVNINCTPLIPTTEEGPQDLSFSKEPPPPPPPPLPPPPPPPPPPTAPSTSSTSVTKMEVEGEEFEDFVSDSNSGGAFACLTASGQPRAFSERKKAQAEIVVSEGPADLSKPGPSGMQTSGSEVEVKTATGLQELVLGNTVASASGEHTISCSIL